VVFRENRRSQWRNFLAVAKRVTFTKAYYVKVWDFENEESHGKGLWAK